jgi:hypothetical protein
LTGHRVTTGNFRIGAASVARFAVDMPEPLSKPCVKGVSATQRET